MPCPTGAHGHRGEGLKILKIHNKEIDLALKQPLGQECQEPIRASLSQATASKNQVPESRHQHPGSGGGREGLGAPSCPASTWETVRYR